MSRVSIPLNPLPARHAAAQLPASRAHLPASHARTPALPCALLLLLPPAVWGSWWAYNVCLRYLASRRSSGAPYRSSAWYPLASRFARLAEPLLKMMLPVLAVSIELYFDHPDGYRCAGLGQKLWGRAAAGPAGLWFAYLGVLIELYSDHPDGCRWARLSPVLQSLSHPAARRVWLGWLSPGLGERFQLGQPGCG